MIPAARQVRKKNVLSDCYDFRVRFHQALLLSSLGIDFTTYFAVFAGCELDDVWSIRKNVQVSQAGKKGTVLNTNKSTTSYYSRHGGLSGR